MSSACSRHIEIGSTAQPNLPPPILCCMSVRARCSAHLPIELRLLATLFRASQKQIRLPGAHPRHLVTGFAINAITCDTVSAAQGLSSSYSVTESDAPARPNDTGTPINGPAT